MHFTMRFATSLIMAISSAATAQPAAVWYQANSLPAIQRDYAGMTYDSARGVCVMFGGHTTDLYLGDTWEWNGRSWTRRSLTGPDPRENCVMVYDESRGVTVLYGGYANLTVPETPAGRRVFSDTWEWDGNTWTQRMVTGPGQREASCMAYDSDRHVCVLFGGYVESTGYANDTWEWNGTTWSQRIASNSAGSPSKRVLSFLVYDSDRHKTVMFGGWTSTNMNDTWEWDGVSWTPRETSAIPPHHSHCMTYDRSRHLTTLFGGSVSTSFDGDFSGDMWTYDGTTWTLEATEGPPARQRLSMAYDSRRKVSVMFGGQLDHGRAYDTWEYGTDTDGDRVPDGSDNCPNVANADQADVNGNYIGDVCDPNLDTDGDNVADYLDNCPNNFNPAQADADGDHVGDVCDQCPGTYPGVSVNPTGCPVAFGPDFDNDGDVDQSDFGVIQRCLNPLAAPPSCAAANFNDDFYINAADMSIFMSCMQGPDLPRNENCLP